MFYTRESGFLEDAGIRLYGPKAGPLVARIYRLKGKARLRAPRSSRFERGGVWRSDFTGVRAGSLDQATEQKGRAGQGTLISSNPRDNYRIIGTYPVPADRFQIVFPYSVERDRTAWRWSSSPRRSVGA